MTTSSSSETYRSVSYSTSSDDETSSSSTVIETTVETSSPDTSDDADGLYAGAGVDGVALGDNTLTTGDISALVEDEGDVTSADLTATVVAISQSSDGDAYTSAESDAYVAGDAEVLFGYTVDADSTEQSEAGSVSTSSSTTTVTAYDIEGSSSGEDTSFVADGTSGDAAASGDGALVPSDEQQAGTSSTETDTVWDLDGNSAFLEIEAFAIGEDTFVSADAFVLVVEDELSLSSGFVVLAVD
jgi:hypothetical protein